MGYFTGCLSIGDLADCDLIIEAVFENMDLKLTIFANIDRIAKPGVILATNTLALNIDEIAAMTKRSQDVIGLHFFSLANVMKLLEIVRADQTSDDIVATCMALAKMINKIAVLVGSVRGLLAIGSYSNGRRRR
ncbi:MAG: 3-hydroxyacyl-CoA dehydrogenase NAD-binding domain-containing protein [Paracoccaceae bacterium]|nr:3-hydroxyacyl-CoA dehydrogenase NAD-binding domain-containing protein [Paracoccaceae bacterium]